MLKPVMSLGVEEDVNNALAQFTRRDQWRKWGMHELRDQGPSILLIGPPGVGKTSIAKYMALKIKKGFKRLDVSSLACEGSPGQYEQNLRKFFLDCKKRGNATIFMDECDQLLLSRDQIGEAGKTWQLGGVETLMTEMNIYRGLVLCATNHPQSLDPAMSDRFLSIIHVQTPDFKMRWTLWKQKIPKEFPLRLTDREIDLIARHVLTGRQIETVIINTASNSLREGKPPTGKMLETFIFRELKKNIAEG